MKKKLYFLLILSIGSILLFISYHHIQNKATFTLDHPIEIHLDNREVITVTTFNIQYGKGQDNRVDVNRTIDTLRGIDADIISLQEVERNSFRSYFRDQVTMIAEELDMNAVFSPSLTYPGLYYGNAILSRYPIEETKTLSFSNRVEDRSAMLSRLRVKEGQAIYVMNTHLGLNREERLEAIDIIYENLKKLEDPIILTGDLNSLPIHQEYTVWDHLLTKTNKGTPIQTYRDKDWQIDYIFHSSDFIVKETRVAETDASDHFPVTAMLLLKSY
jgi:endonuclease/exonuclease/phosphatase family metal-dependent hydrolase